MSKYGFRDNKVKAEEVTADSVDASSIAFSGDTVGTAASGTAAYIPVTIDGNTYYIEAKM